MAKEIEFDPTGGKIYVNIKIQGLVIVSYTLRLWSADVANEKVLQTEVGNNKQAHDDFFWLRNKSNEWEPVTNNDNRFVELITTVHTDRDDNDYSISMVFSQGNDPQNQTEIGVVTVGKTINESDNGQRPVLGAVLKAKSI